MLKPGVSLTLTCMIHEVAAGSVIPAKAGIHSGAGGLTWISVYTGMTAAD